MSVLSRFRSMPEGRRSIIAAIIAGIVTILIGIGWFMLTFAAPTTQQTSGQSSGETTRNPL